MISKFSTIKSMARHKKNIPECVGIIMDGNRRWAKSHHVPTARGHAQGYETLKQAVRWAKHEQVGTLVVYAFSTENWKRSKLEVGLLMKLFSRALTEIGKDAREEDARVSFIGDRAQFSKTMQAKMGALEQETRNNASLHLVLAMSYGGRAEITHAVNTMLASGKKRASEDDVAKGLWSAEAGIPDPDLIIRTGGEMRLSNFLLWQAAYSEFFFTETLWPDFSEQEFSKILREYANRERRRGK